MTAELPPIRVLHLIETGGPGGAERMLLDLVRHLGPGYTSTLGLLKPGWLQTTATLASIPSVLLAGNALGDFGTLRKTFQFVRANEIQLLHTHEFYMNLVGAIIARVSRIPHVATLHGKKYHTEKRRRRAFYRFAAKRTSRLVAVSQDLQKFLCAHFNVSQDKVAMIYNGIDLSPFADVQRNPQLLESLGISVDAFIVGTVGNLYALKGHTYLIRAAHGVMQKRPNTHLLILGRGELKNPLEQEAKALGIADRVHLLGYRDDTPRWLGVMNVFVLSSLSEGLPLSLLEAMASSLPTIVTQIGGMPEVVREGETGVVVPPGDCEALTKSILFFHDNPNIAKQYGRAGRIVVFEDFSVDRMVHQYRSLYREVLAGKS